MAELREVKEEVQLARDKGISTPAVLQRRAAEAEAAFLRLTASLLEAPDPMPLLRASAALTCTVAGGVLGHTSLSIRDITSTSVPSCTAAEKSGSVEQPGVIAAVVWLAGL